MEGNAMFGITFSETLLATLIGALASFLGVLFTLRADREKAKQEREFLAKHQAMLSAADAVLKFINYYITFPDRELPKAGEVPNDVAEMGIALNRLHFYCGLETIRCSIEMGQILSSSYANALKAKMPSFFLGEEIKSIEVQIAGFENNNSRLQQEILAMIPAGSFSSQIATHRQFVANNFKEIAALYDKRCVLIKKKYEATEACRDVVVNDLKAVYGAVRNVLLMARRELSFPINEKSYGDIMGQATDASFSAIKDLYAEIRSQIKAKMEQLD